MSEVELWRKSYMARLKSYIDTYDFVKIAAASELVDAEKILAQLSDIDDAYDQHHVVVQMERLLRVIDQTYRDAKAILGTMQSMFDSEGKRR